MRRSRNLKFKRFRRQNHFTRRRKRSIRRGSTESRERSWRKCKL